jgi:uncharacterized membrane protein HdeD (DUF308 family)
MKQLKWNMVFMSAVYIALGAVLLIWPETVLNAVCYVVGGLVMLSGVVQVVRFFAARERLLFAPMTLTLGLVCLGLGLFLILRSDIVQTVLPIVFGLFVIFDSVVRIQSALELKKCEYGNWWTGLLLALLSVVLGLVMIFNPFASIQTLVMAVGVILIIEGALNVISILYTQLAVHRFMKKHPAAEAALEALTGEDLNGDGVVAAPVTEATVEGSAVERDAPADAPADNEQAAADRDADEAGDDPERP